ncbi:MAG: hypothetical protein FJ087_21325, partial [Deltaproteobacteria bacterium]|nr:hypothetical protein [Deltaproteobacteria bacterium]
MTTCVTTRADPRLHAVVARRYPAALVLLPALVAAACGVSPAGPRCTPGVQRCNGVHVEQCATDGSEWLWKIDCEPGQTCSDGSCLGGADATAEDPSGTEIPVEDAVAADPGQEAAGPDEAAHDTSFDGAAPDGEPFPDPPGEDAAAADPTPADAPDPAPADVADPPDPGTCTPMHHKGCCGTAVCWFDSCGSAGEQVAACPYGCDAGVCKTCTPACAGKTCGEDGCGGTCGGCASWTVCVDGACVQGIAIEEDQQVCHEGWCFAYPQVFDYRFMDLCARGPNDVWGTGQGDFLVRFDGTRWTRVAIPEAPPGWEPGMVHASCLPGSKIVAGSTRTVMVGDAGKWTVTAVPDSALEITDIFATGGSAFYASTSGKPSERASLYQYDGSAWSPVPFAKEKADECFQIAGTGPDRMFVLCEGADGTDLVLAKAPAWTAIVLPPDTDTIGAFADGTLFALHGSGTRQLSFHDGTWKPAPPGVTAQSYRVVWGDGPSSFHAIVKPSGSSGCDLVRWDGSAWTVVDLGQECMSTEGYNYDDRLSIVPMPSGGFLAAGSDDLLYRHDGKVGGRVGKGTLGDPRAVWMSEDGTLGMVADSELYRFGGGAWQRVCPEHKVKAPLRGTGSALWAPTGYGSLLEADAGQCNLIQVPAQGPSVYYDDWDLSSLWVAAPGDAWWVAKNGALLHYEGGAWSVAQTGRPQCWSLADGDFSPCERFEGVWAASPGSVLAWGCSRVLRFDGTTWSELDLKPILGSTAYCLAIFDVWGTAADSLYMLMQG